MERRIDEPPKRERKSSRLTAEKKWATIYVACSLLPWLSLFFVYAFPEVDFLLAPCVLFGMAFGARILFLLILMDALSRALRIALMLAITVPLLVSYVCLLTGKNRVAFSYVCLLNTMLEIAIIVHINAIGSPLEDTLLTAVLAIPNVLYVRRLSFHKKEEWLDTPGFKLAPRKGVQLPDKILTALLFILYSVNLSLFAIGSWSGKENGSFGLTLALWFGSGMLAWWTIRKRERTPR